MLEIKQLQKRYHQLVALDHISCCFKPGITAILGPNGAGKSTLMSILSLQNQATSGSVLYDGIAIQHHPEYLKDLAYMPQMQNLIPNFTGIEFLYYVGYLKQCSPSEIQQCIKQYEQELELHHCLGQRLKEYSGGMRQRILFLSCLLAKPKILLLDEPTAGLDPMQRNAFKNIISRLAMNTTILLATHIVQDVEDVANHVLILNKGQILCDKEMIELDQIHQGYVYRCLMSKQQLEIVQKKFKVTMVQNQFDHYRVKFISPTKLKNISPIRPSLEDIYLSFIR